MINYGVLKGPIVDFGREDDSSSPHFQIVIRANNNRFRVPVNVKSGDGSQVLFSVVDPLIDHRMLAEFARIPQGFTAAGANPWFLDYHREPMFDRTKMQKLPHAVSGPNNDLQDHIMALVEIAKRDSQPVFAFGAVFPGGDPRPADHQFNTNGGVHDVHMNQGNPVPGRFAGDNGIHQDGGLILQSGPSTFVGVFLAFQTQLLPTDDHGNPLAGAKPILAADTGGNVAAQAIDLSILAACVNPQGDDVGKETVILLNASSTEADLSQFAIQDKNRKREPLTGKLAGGDVRRIVLSGNNAQLGNSGGVVQLVRTADGGIVHAVSYTSQGASVQGRTLVFSS